MCDHRDKTMSISRRDDSEKSTAVEFSRRELCGGALAAAGALTVGTQNLSAAPRQVPPSEKVNLVVVGTGCHGTRHIKSLLANQPDVQIVAICDVNRESSDYRENDYKDGVAGRDPARRIVERHYAEREQQGGKVQCASYRDFREMLDKEKDFDAVIVATPDHTHAVVAMAAMKMGKHVYCEKPLAHSVGETRALAEAARAAGIATQMGNQLHATGDLRRQVEVIQSGVLGPVREVHVWCGNTGWHGPWSPVTQQRWAAFSERFAVGPDRPQETLPVPDELDWDLWLGPAPFRPYHSAYLPFKWRGWWQFGSGTLGDMGCHMLDVPFWGLELDHPVQVEATSTVANSETAPVASLVHYKFPARGELPPVRLTWYDGGLQPPRPEELPAGRELPGFGLLFVGDRGKMLATYNQGFELLPSSLTSQIEGIRPTLPRIDSPAGINDNLTLSFHHREWLDACKGGPRAHSHFDYSGPLTETVLLGVIAIKTGRKLHWDAAQMKITNVPEANKYVRREYRQGWSL